MNHIAKQYVLPHSWITLASAVCAMGFNWCYEPNQTGFGGVTGVGQITNHTLPWIPIGTMVIVLNIPLFLLGWKLLGRHLLVSSLYSMLISSIFIDILHMIHTFEPTESILGCILGGVVMDDSLDVMLLQDATTGGTDLTARLLKLKLAWLSMGRLLPAVDLLVIVAAVVASRDIYSALYSVMALYISPLVMDQVLYGMDNAKVAYIISDAYDQISHAITHDMDRGVTLLHDEGGQPGEDKKVLLMAFKQKQIVAFEQTARSIDSNTFLIVYEAHEILDDGFRKCKYNDL